MGRDGGCGQGLGRGYLAVWGLLAFGDLPEEEIWIPLPINFVASGGAVAFDGYLLNRRGIPDLYPNFIFPEGGITTEAWLEPSSINLEKIYIL